MTPVAPLDVDSIRWAQYLYFAGGIAVIILGAIGTIVVILGILQTKFLKPYRNRYPVEEFKSFDEFVFKNPANPLNQTLQEAYPNKKTEPKNVEPDDLPIITWENAKDFIPNLTAKEYKAIEISNEERYEPVGEK